MALPVEDERDSTPEQYLALERAALDGRWEYLDGEIRPMAGASEQHDTIVANLIAFVHAQLRGTPCRPFTANMKVRTTPVRLFSYPDLTVVCGQPQYHDEHRDVLINPRVIFEVLSPSTEDYDRGSKRVLYQSLESLTDYVLVEQHKPLVEHWTRQPENRWLVERIEGREATLDLECIGCMLPLQDVYERVDFTKVKRPRRVRARRGRTDQPSG
ncbi:MAG: Uma2 family endonuclease [Candidatus Xenobia bacterium]